ncbi:MAG: hypothetical protein RR672_11160, partial [Raoultibacter sp.]
MADPRDSLSLSLDDILAAAHKLASEESAESVAEIPEAPEAVEAQSAASQPAQEAAPAPVSESASSQQP